MIKSINNLRDVKDYAQYLTSLSLNFHPDEDFANYINYSTRVRVFTDSEVLTHNDLMDQCFEVCQGQDADIYSLMLDVLLVETGLDRIIPRP